VRLDSKGSEEVCTTRAAAAGRDGTAATEDGFGASVFTGPTGRGQCQAGL